MTPKLIRVTFIYIAVLSSVLICGSRVAAQFTLETNNGSITITGYSGPGGNVAIPGATNGYLVTAIGTNAFSGQITVTGVTIPDSVTNLEPGAFYASGLTYVTLPNSISSIGEEAFGYCSQLMRATISDSVINIGGGAFFYSGLTSVAIGNHVTSLGSEAFYYCPGLTSVTIPNSVINLGTGAFDECGGLTNVTVGSGVTNLGAATFRYCFNLHQAYFLGNAPSVDGAPGSLDNSVFLGDTGTAYYVSGATGWNTTFGGWPTALSYPFTFVTNNGSLTITSYTGPGGNVTIPSSINGYAVTGIGTSAFQDQLAMTTVTIPVSVTNIGLAAFLDSGLTNVTLPNSIINLGDQAFAYCPNLRSVTISDSIINLGDQAFAYCPNLRSVTISDSVISIGGGAFEFCTNLANVTLGNNVASIGNGAFNYCPALASLTIPNSVSNLGFAVFDSSGLTNVIIGNSVTNLSAGMFRHCPLTSVTIPNSVTSIGAVTFYQCQQLASATIGSGVKSIDLSAFEFCTLLTNIAVSVANPVYASAGGVLFDKTMATLILFPYGLNGSYVVPNSVTSIGDSAFAECPGVTSVTMGSGITHIGSLAFSLCSSLHQAYFQGNAPSADSSVFNADTGTAYYLPGTTGWATTFGGWPTAAWFQPQPQILGLSRQSHGFQFTISWATNTSVIIEACTNLASPVWMPLATNSLVQGTNYFADPQWTNSPRRFYRAVAAP